MGATLFPAGIFVEKLKSGRQLAGKVSRLEKGGHLGYAKTGFGRAENRSGRKSGEESPNSIGRDAA